MSALFFPPWILAAAAASLITAATASERMAPPTALTGYRCVRSESAAQAGHCVRCAVESRRLECRICSVRRDGDVGGCEPIQGPVAPVWAFSPASAAAPDCGFADTDAARRRLGERGISCRGCGAPPANAGYAGQGEACRTCVFGAGPAGQARCWLHSPQAPPVLD